jgi:hypothetical protein
MVSGTVACCEALWTPWARLGRSTQMAEPIANDWKAINDRMRQIQAERSAASRPCTICNGLGWIPEFSDGPRESRVVPCYLCKSPKKQLPPSFPRI